MVDFMLIKSAFGVIITFWSNFALDIQKKCRQNLYVYQADHLVKTITNGYLLICELII